MQLSNPVGAGIADGIGNGMIVNDDAVPAPPSNKPTASIGDASVAEGGLGTTTTMSFPVSLSKASSDAVTSSTGPPTDRRPRERLRGGRRERTDPGGRDHRQH